MTSMRLCDHVQLPPDEARLLPRGWQILGSMILVSIPNVLEDHAEGIGDALLEMYPRCRTVLWNKGVSGAFREPHCEVIAGVHETETVHKENGCYFKLDVAKIMFSQGNLRERMQMGNICDGEVVLDMFAGIGYFSIQIAVHSHPEKVISIELNPTSHHYLQENIKINKVDDIVLPIHGDCTVKSQKDTADRVIMGYLDSSQEQLIAGMLAARKGGILHYHEATPTVLTYQRPIERIRGAARIAGRSVEILECRTIKKYAPGVVHVVVDVVVDAV
ncbi:MAG: hypothetical protein BA870_03220 [Desulfuromonadales bacterium C00003094]|nr:MAG: hypothetical protein BA870_03220 [Desulfuromonadales bacterium C00003094]